MKLKAKNVTMTDKDGNEVRAQLIVCPNPKCGSDLLRIMVVRGHTQTCASHGGANRCFMTETKHIYEIRPRKHKRGVDLSDVLPFGRLWYGKVGSNQQRYRLREAQQPFTWCCDSRLRCGWQRD